jgi:hypothetical protein
MKYLKSLVLAGLVSVMSIAPSFAEAIDVTAATTQITTEGTAAVSAVGLAIIGLAAVAMTLRWVKATFF